MVPFDGLSLVKCGEFVVIVTDLPYNRQLS